MIPHTSALFMPCALSAFLEGSQGGRYAPPGYVQHLGQHPKIVFWVVFLFLANFAIFSGFVN
jgi:hypothetical protein